MFYFYGSKARLAPYFPAPEHELIVEPFAGAAGYAVHNLAHGRAAEALLYDVDERVVEMWDRLLRLTPDEVLELEMSPAGTRTTDPLHYTVMTSNAWGRISGAKITPRMVRMWPSMKRRMARLLPHLRGRITVEHAPYTAAPDVEATWFVDPPYQITSAGCRNSGYVATVDHHELGRWSRARAGQLIACDQAGATWLPFRPLIDALDSGGRRRTEVIHHRSTSGEVNRLPVVVDNRLYPEDGQRVVHSPTLERRVA